MRSVTQQTNKTTEELGREAAKTFPSIGSEKEFSETKLQNPVAQRKDTGLWQDIEITWRIIHRQHNTQWYSSIPRWQTRVPLFSEVSGQQSYSTLSS